MQSKTWLRCNVTPGQFTGEYVVTARDFRNSTFSLFVPDECVEYEGELVEGQSASGLVQVEILDQNATLALVQLPRLPLENGQTVTVNKSDLIPRPARELA